MKLSKKPTKQECLNQIRAYSLHFISMPESYWKDEEYFFRALEKNVSVEIFIPKTIVRDPQKFIRAIHTNPRFYTFYTNRLHNKGKKHHFINNFEVMLNAVNQNGMALTDVSPALLKTKWGRELALAAVKQNGRIYYWISRKNHPLNMFHDDLEIAKEAAKTCDCIIFELSSKLYHNPEVIANVILCNPAYLSMYISDKKFVMSLIEARAEIVKFVEWINKSNAKIIFELVTKHNPEIIKYASKGLRENSTFNLKLIKENGAVFPHLVERFKRNPFAQLRAIESGVTIEEVEKYISYDTRRLVSKKLNIQLEAFKKLGIAMENIEQYIFHEKHTLTKEEKMTEIENLTQAGMGRKEIGNQIINKYGMPLEQLKKEDIGALKLYSIFEKANQKAQSEGVKSVKSVKSLEYVESLLHH